jgi:ABC-type multidrug transport system fused ATPase/permease subunit
MNLGAGKSSLFQPIFRLIDGIDINGISLHKFRSQLIVIPQSPILFAGTLHYNLDPSEQCLLVLESVQIKHIVLNNPAGLDQLVAESGSNYSADNVN